MRRNQLLFTVEDVCDCVRLSRATIYRQIASGRLQSVHIGRSLRITEDALHTWVLELKR